MFLDVLKNEEKNHWNFFYQKHFSICCIRKKECKIWCFFNQTFITLIYLELFFTGILQNIRDTHLIRTYFPFLFELWWIKLVLFSWRNVKNYHRIPIMKNSIIWSSYINGLQFSRKKQHLFSCILFAQTDKKE